MTKIIIVFYGHIYLIKSINAKLYCVSGCLWRWPKLGPKFWGGEKTRIIQGKIRFNLELIVFKILAIIPTTTK